MRIYDYSEIEFALWAIATLGLVVLVSLVSYAARNRSMLLLGMVSCFAGFLIPKSHRTGQTFESSLHWMSSHIIYWGFIGALIGCCIAWALTKKWQFFHQFSIAGLLVVTGVFALIVMLFVYFLDWH